MMYSSDIVVVVAALPPMLLEGIRSFHTTQLCGAGNSGGTLAGRRRPAGRLTRSRDSLAPLKLRSFVQKRAITMS